MDVSYVRRTDAIDVVESLRVAELEELERATLSKTMWKKLVRTAHGVPHSPLRAIEYRFYIKNIPSWVSVHLVRHHIGCQPYVTSQRPDRTGEEIDRSKEPQGALVNMIWDLNANALIDIAKARLCINASTETRDVVTEMRKKLIESNDMLDTEVGANMVAPCDIYGKCFEINSCMNFI
jgi:thymidylate synthase ThyX